LVDGDESPWVWKESFLIFLAIECFRRPHESFIQVLHSVAVVSWKANYENLKTLCSCPFPCCL
jgi:hypothetical protein